LAPVFFYASAHSVSGGGFGLTETQGWFLYGRVGEIADCSHFEPTAAQRPLCNDEPPPGKGRNVRWYLWDRTSPANRMFGYVTSLRPEQVKRSDELLGDFAMKAIRARPGAYADLVATDFVRFFRPGEMTRFGDDSDDPITFPARTRPGTYQAEKAERFFAVGSAPEVRAPSGFLREYQRVLHTPRWLLGVLALAGLAVLLLGLSRRLRPLLPRRLEVMLLIGAPLLMLLGTAATASSLARYLVPLVPLFVCGGVAVALDLWNLWSRRGQPAAP
jgi:hypothetical protein